MDGQEDSSPSTPVFLSLCSSYLNGKYSNKFVEMCT